MENLPEIVVFRAEDLLSKWGFGDGDMLDDFEVAAEVGEDCLVEAVRHFLVPKLPSSVVLEDFSFGTIHNPIRAANGTDPALLRGIKVYVAAPELIEFIKATVAERQRAADELLRDTREA